MKLLTKLQENSMIIITARPHSKFIVIWDARMAKKGRK